MVYTMSSPTRGEKDALHRCADTFYAPSKEHKEWRTWLIFVPTSTIFQNVAFVLDHGGTGISDVVLVVNVYQSLVGTALGGLLIPTLVLLPLFGRLS